MDGVADALGSALATVLLSKDISLVQGFAALALVICMQFVVTWLAVWVGWVRRLVTSESMLLTYDGEFVQDALTCARDACRGHGCSEGSRVGPTVRGGRGRAGDGRFMQRHQAQKRRAST